MYFAVLMREMVPTSDLILEKVIKIDQLEKTEE